MSNFYYQLSFFVSDLVCLFALWYPPPELSADQAALQWLPNQLSAVMDLMVSVYDTYLAPLMERSSSTSAERPDDFEKLQRTEFPYQVQVEEMMVLVRDQRQKLAKEVERWCLERGV